jgi:4-aminobutyrate aminotransferase-like enzyme
MLIGVELVADRETKDKVAPTLVRRLLGALARRGVLLAGGGHILRIAPPLIINEDMALRGVAALDDALTEVEG